MGKFRIYTQILQGNALFSGKIYTAGKYLTRPPVVTVATNFKSAHWHADKQDKCGKFFNSEEELMIHTHLGLSHRNYCTRKQFSKPCAYKKCNV